MPARHLPPRPNLRQLRHQAKDLLRAFHRGDPSALADFREYHAERIDPANAYAGRRAARAGTKLSGTELVAADPGVPNHRGHFTR